jgi:hypothetical protein
MMPNIIESWLDHTQSDRDFVASAQDPVSCEVKLSQWDRIRKFALLFFTLFGFLLIIENALVGNIPSSNSLLVIGFVLSAIFYLRVDFKIKTIKLYAATTGAAAPRPQA